MAILSSLVGGEEAEVLANHNIPFEIVPGITSGIAAPAYAGIPVTHRDFSSSVAFVTAVNKPGMDKEQYWNICEWTRNVMRLYGS